MGELMNARNGARNFRLQLLTTVSAFAFLTAVYGSSETKAADQDMDRPTIWIELGGQMEHVGGEGEPFSPSFIAANPASIVFTPMSPLQAQNPPPFSFGENGAITFQPESSDWVFSASLQYGRSSNIKEVDHQTYNVLVTKYNSGVPHPGNHLAKHRFADTRVRHQENHTVLDFSAGKDVGLGMFGNDSSSIFRFGVRLAQFTSKTMVDFRAVPDIHFASLPIPTYHVTLHLPYFHNYHATGDAARSFHGVGPSLSWTVSAPAIGNPQGGEISIDWGANAALLFGRQKAITHHQLSAQYHSRYGELQGGQYISSYQEPPGGHNAAHSVMVPNVGGFAGASYRIENFKVSLGYRADFFFGAVDGGIDVRKSETLGFYGPFASVSVGLGG